MRALHSQTSAATTICTETWHLRTRPHLVAHVHGEDTEVAMGDPGGPPQQLLPRKVELLLRTSRQLLAQDLDKRNIAEPHLVSFIRKEAISELKITKCIVAREWRRIAMTLTEVVRSKGQQTEADLPPTTKQSLVMLGAVTSHVIWNLACKKVTATVCKTGNLGHGLVATATLL